jgi:hypothetical protein
LRAHLNALIEIHLRVWHSFRRLPLWVQLWMAAVLLPVNLASLALLHYSSAQWIAVSAVMVVACNMLLIYKYGGFNRLLAIPHLLIWGPLQIMLVMHLAGQAPESVYTRSHRTGCHSGSE